MTHFIIHDARIRSNAIDHILGLDLLKQWLVDIKPFVKNRTNSQNRLYWKWMEIIGNDTGNSREEMHEVFKHRHLGNQDKEFDGNVYTISNTTTKLTTKEFTDYLQAIEVDAMGLGITLPHPQDYNYAMGGKL